jgi:hypothetical protein
MMVKLTSKKGWAMTADPINWAGPIMLQVSPFEIKFDLGRDPLAESFVRAASPLELVNGVDEIKSCLLVDSNN